MVEQRCPNAGADDAEDGDGGGGAIAVAAAVAAVAVAADLIWFYHF